MAALAPFFCAWLAWVSLPGTSAVLSRAEWNEHFNSDAHAAFDSDEDMLQHTSLHLHRLASLRPSSLAELRVREAYVLRLRQHREHETHKALRAVVEADGGSYTVSSTGQYATVVCTPAAVLRLSHMDEHVESVAHMQGEMKIHRELLHDCQVPNAVVALTHVDATRYRELLHEIESTGCTLHRDAYRASVEEASGLFDRIHSDSPRFVQLQARDCDHLIDVARFVSAFPEVLFIEQVHEMTTFNEWAHGTIQTAGSTSNTDVWSAGLSGSGQIIGIADTGLDVYSCYFYDSTCDAATGSTNCRKTFTEMTTQVVKYISYVDNQDQETSYGGHGTHVTGSAIGECDTSYPYCSTYKLLNGNGYGGKVAFFDFGDKYGNLYTPSNLNTDMFTPMYSAGARVFSNSWGSSSTIYDISSYQTDSFLYSNPAAAMFFAAGNNGTYGDMTVGSPGNAKNVITVGASLSDTASWTYIADNYGGGPYNSSVYTYTTVAGGKILTVDVNADFSSRGYTPDGRLKPDIVAPGYYLFSAYSLYNPSSEHCGAVGFAGMPLTHAQRPRISYRVSMIRTTVWDSGTSMATPTAAGGSLLIREYFVNSWYPASAKGGGVSITPSGALIKAMMIHSAQPMAGVLSGSELNTDIKYPGPEQGYGRIQLNKVLTYSSNTGFTLAVRGAADSSSDYYVSMSSTGEKHTITVQIASSSEPLKATLVWTDPVASLTASNVLVNDLDLTIVDTDGVTYYPILSNTADHVNNVEQVEMTNPVVGQNYTVNVEAYSLSSNQPYALVITGGLITATVATSASSAASTLLASPLASTILVAAIVLLTNAATFL